MRSVFRCVASRNRKNSPAPGFRDSGYRTAENGAGKLYAVGYSGYGWSSSIPTGSGNARYLHFNYGFLARMDSKTPGGRAADFTLEPGRAQPSRGESISFLSPAQAAGAPTFCDATESRQRTQPRGLRPLGHPPTFFGLPSQKVRPVAHPPLRLCKTRLECPAAPTGPAMRSIANGSAKFSVRSSAKISPWRTDATRRTGLLLENRDRRSRAPPPPPAEGATSLLLRRLRGRLRKRTSPHGLWPHA